MRIYEGHLKIFEIHDANWRDWTIEPSNLQVFASAVRAVTLWAESVGGSWRGRGILASKCPGCGAPPAQHSPILFKVSECLRSACPCDSMRCTLLIHSKKIKKYLTVFTPKGNRRMKMDFGFHFKSFLDLKCQTVIEWTRCFDLPFCKTLLGVSKFLEYLGVEACQTLSNMLNMSKLVGAWSHACGRSKVWCTR